MDLVESDVGDLLRARGGGDRSGDTRPEEADLVGADGRDSECESEGPGSSAVSWFATSCSSAHPGGPGIGLRPSRKALAISVAFHLAYLIFSRFCGVSERQIGCEFTHGRTDSDISMLLKVLRVSRKLAAARNFLAVDLRLLREQRLIQRN